MATVYKRGGIYWCAYPGFDGLRRVESTGTRDKRLARLYADKMEMRHYLVRIGEMDASELETKERGAAAIASVLAVYLPTVKSKAHRKEKSAVLDAFLEHAGVKQAAAMGQAGITGKVYAFIRASQDRKNTIAWTNKQLWHVQQFGDWLYRNNYIRFNEASKVEPLAGRDARKVIHAAFTPAQAEAFCTNAYGDFYRFLMWTGLRGEEAVRLTPKDIAGDLLTVRAEIAKNGLACVLPLAPALHERFGRKVGGELFPDVPSDRANRRRALLRHLRAAGLHGFNGRSFRMTHNTWLRLAGLDDATIGTLRRDRGEGSALLRRWNYTDAKQLLPHLRGELRKVDAWYAQALQPAKAVLSC